MRILLTFVAGLLLMIGTVHGETLAPGNRMPAISLADQHDVQASIGAETRIVLFARDMDGADIVEEALAEHGAAVLAGAGAVFVSDIHRMPGIITRLFALPAMRKRPYRMLLDRDGTATADLPSREDQVSLIRLDQLEIESVDYFDSAGALRAALVGTPAER